MKIRESLLRLSRVWFDERCAGDIEAAVLASCIASVAVMVVLGIGERLQQIGDWLLRVVN